MAAQFASYPQLTIEERQHLVAVTRWYLHQQKMGRWGEGMGRNLNQNQNQKSKPNYPRTTPLVQSNSVDVTRRIAPA